MFTKKKLASLVLAGAMVASLAVPAFAEDVTPATPAGQSVITAKYDDIKIAVTVASVGEVVINPYGSPIQYTDSNDKAYEITGQQLTTKPNLYISNESGTDLDIGATVTVSDIKGVELVSKTTGGVSSKGSDKQAYVYLEVAAVDSATENATLQKLKGDLTDDDDMNDAVMAAHAEAATWANSKKLTLNGDDEAVTSTESLGLLKKAATPRNDENGDDPVAAVGSIALFRLGGDCVPNPEEAWAKTDTFKVNVAFTFTPHIEATP